MLLILCGKSGSGKDTVASEILNDSDFGADRLISTTSRPIRDGEEDGREYHFTDKDSFVRDIAAGKFVEYRSYDTLVGGTPDVWYYGTKAFGKSQEDTVTVAIKDLQGAKVLKDYCEKIGEPCIAVLMEVPDAIREERARMRGSFDKTEWDRRLNADAIDFSEEAVAQVIDYFVDNRGEDTVAQIASRIEMWCRDEIRDAKNADLLFGDSLLPIDRYPTEMEMEMD